ncbi:MAG: ATP-binding cassette domain-containing protein, partial [Candidatus Eisenbacteria bacterium]|nr:ATP-binding cassette domain-containing protein [Candidatus Eisenbacteria bacterium]
RNLVVVRRSSRNGASVETTVLHDVDLDVPAGEVFGVIGPSGSGKTTLLRALNALEEPAGGSVLLDGVDTTEIETTELRRRVGMVFQTPALFDGTVFQNVAYGLRLAAGDERAVADRVAECLAFVGLAESFIERDAAELSQGEQQRVSIARALAPEPEVFLMDEPTSALDPTATERVLGLVGALRDEAGLTVVFVTHLMEQARRVCDRALVLVEGRGVETGPVPELFESPSSELTRRFIQGRFSEEEHEEVSA